MIKVEEKLYVNADVFSIKSQSQLHTISQHQRVRIFDRSRFTKGFPTRRI